METFNVKKVFWHEIRKIVPAEYNEFSVEVDKWKEAVEFPLYLAEYEYGNPILNEGILHIPLKDGNVVSINDAKVPNELRENLTYSPVPLALILNKSCEVFYDFKDRIFSLANFMPGIILGLWEVLDQADSEFTIRFWSMKAGSCSLYMIPKITDRFQNEKLIKKFLLNSKPPKEIKEQFYFFEELAKKISEKWTMKILFFSKEWLANNTNSIGALKFQNLLYKIGWKLTEYWRNQKTFEVIWDRFCNYLRDEGETLDPYIINTVKHLVYVGSGVLPGLSPCIDNEAAPIFQLQDIYINDYELKNYVPTFISPKHLKAQSNTVYYSVYVPTLLESFPKKKTPKTILNEMRTLQRILHKFMKAALEGIINVKNTPIFQVVENIEFDFFHSEGNNMQILNSSQLVIDDPRLGVIINKANKKNLVFSDKYGFVNGCIRISI